MAKQKSKTNDDTRRVLFARLPEPVHAKLKRLAAKRSAKVGERVTLQDMVIELIQGATG